MKNLFLIIVVLICSAPAFAQNGVVNVHINGIKSTKGYVQIGIFNTKSTFPIFGKQLKAGKVKPNTNGVDYSFKDLPDGTYAIAAWHDKNNNEKIDKNLFGVPKEKYGFSNNVYGMFGPPSFEKVTFQVKNGEVVALTINLD